MRPPAIVEAEKAPDRGAGLGNTDAGPSGEEGKGVDRCTSITIGSISCALERTLQTVEFLTLAGTEGASSQLDPSSLGRSGERSRRTERKTLDQPAKSCNFS